MLAEKLGLPMQAVRRNTTATEFLQWHEYFRREEERKMKTVEKTDFYLARLAALMCSLWGDGKKKHYVKDFLLHFEEKPKPKSKIGAVLTEEEWKRRRAARAETAKAFWLAPIMGGTKRKTRNKPRKQGK